MKSILTKYLKTKPHLFDVATRLYRALPSHKDDTYKFFDRF